MDNEKERIPSILRTYYLVAETISFLCCLGWSTVVIVLGESSGQARLGSIVCILLAIYFRLVLLYLKR